MKKIIAIVLVLVILFALSCAAGPNDLTGKSRSEKSPAGFLLGLWHGLIAPVSFIVSLFNKSVNVYEVYNSGGWYNFGFILGLSTIFGGSGGAGKHYSSKRRKRDED